MIDAPRLPTSLIGADAGSAWEAGWKAAMALVAERSIHPIAYARRDDLDELIEGSCSGILIGDKGEHAGRHIPVFIHDVNADWEANAKYLLDSYPDAIRVRPGGGKEVLMHSLCVTFIAMCDKLGVKRNVNQ